MINGVQTGTNGPAPVAAGQDRNKTDRNVTLYGLTFGNCVLKYRISYE